MGLGLGYGPCRPAQMVLHMRGAWQSYHMCPLMDTMGLGGPLGQTKLNGEQLAV